MPWRKCHKMDERLKFVARRLDGEKTAVLCREFGISRKTGYKMFSRYKGCGLVARPIPALSEAFEAPDQEGAPPAPTESRSWTYE